MATKVYVVTRGEYSDYHVVGIFSTKKKAECYIKSSTWTDDKPSMFECELDELLNFKTVLVVMDRDGNVLDTFIRDGKTLEYDLSEPDDVLFLNDDRMSCKVRVPVDSECEMIERAVKIANERRAFFIANGMYGKTAEYFKHGTSTVLDDE